MWFFSWAKKGPTQCGLHSVCLVCGTCVSPVLVLMLSPNLSPNHCPKSFARVAMTRSLHVIRFCWTDYLGEARHHLEIRQWNLRNVVFLWAEERPNKMWSAFHVQHGGPTARRLCKMCHAVFAQIGGPTKCAQQTVCKIAARFVSVWFMAHVLGPCLFWCSRFISLPFLVQRASLLLRTANLA